MCDGILHVYFFHYLKNPILYVHFLQIYLQQTY